MALPSSICLHMSMFVIVYVDDITVTKSSLLVIASPIRDLCTHFTMKDLGPLHYFRRIEVTKHGSGLHLSKAKYVRDLLQCLYLDGLKPISTVAVVG